MTKAERFAAKIERDKEALAQRQATSPRDVTRQATNKRRYQVGALADDAGLLAWSNADLAGLFTALATLKDVPTCRRPRNSAWRSPRMKRRCGKRPARSRTNAATRSGPSPMRRDCWRGVMPRSPPFLRGS